MGLETVTNIDDLVVTNPLSTDARSQGDDHIRNIKLALKTDFPNINAAVTATPAELNLTSGITAGTVLASKFVLVDSNKKVNEWLVDNITIDGNTITATTGALNLTPAAGSAIVLDGTINVDAGVVTGATSITSTAFVGTLSTAAQANVTSLGTLTALQTDNININGNTIISTDTAGDINITPDTTGDLVLDGLKWPQADGSANQILVTDGAAQTSWATPTTTTVLTTHGDVLFRNASALARLGVGTAGQFLTTQGAGADPTWTTGNTTQGVHTIYVPANAMKATTSNGCALLATVETTAGRPDMNVLDFDKDADEHAQFNVAFPNSWNLGTITFQVFWAGIAATTGVAWGLQGLAISDNATIDQVFSDGTPVVVTDDAQGAVEEMLVTAESGALTIANTPADGDLCYFRIFRDVSDANDDMAGDARLIGVKLFYTTDAETDA